MSYSIGRRSRTALLESCDEEADGVVRFGPEALDQGRLVVCEPRRAAAGGRTCQARAGNSGRVWHEAHARVGAQQPADTADEEGECASQCQRGIKAREGTHLDSFSSGEMVHVLNTRAPPGRSSATAVCSSARW